MAGKVVNSSFVLLSKFDASRQDIALPCPKISLHFKVFFGLPQITQMPQILPILVLVTIMGNRILLLYN
jgi:hypothetical protein